MYALDFLTSLLVIGSWIHPSPSSSYNSEAKWFVLILPPEKNSSISLSLGLCSSPWLAASYDSCCAQLTLLSLMIWRGADALGSLWGSASSAVPLFASQYPSPLVGLPYMTCPMAQRKLLVGQKHNLSLSETPLLLPLSFSRRYPWQREWHFKSLSRDSQRGCKQS